MSSPNHPGPSTWAVTSTIRMPDPANPGSGAYVYEIQFTTGAGATGTIYQPETQIGDALGIRAKIAALAAQLDTVRTLTHDGP